MITEASLGRSISQSVIVSSKTRVVHTYCMCIRVPVNLRHNIRETTNCLFVCVFFYKFEQKLQYINNHAQEQEQQERTATRTTTKLEYRTPILSMH